MPGFITVSRFM